MGALALARTGKAEDVYAFSPKLIGELREEHRTLLKRYSDVEKMVLGGRFDSIPHALAGFKAKFNVHILRESLHCYSYVRRTSARRPLELATVSKLQQRVDAIGRQVLDFVEKHRSAGVSRANAQEFLTGLRAVGQVLNEHIQREEAELFARYKP